MTHGPDGEWGLLEWNRGPKSLTGGQVLDYPVYSGEDFS
jgi:hypothetical protein